MKKKVITLLLASVLGISLMACGSENEKSPEGDIPVEEIKKEPTDLTGTWTQVDHEEAYQQAIISDGIIEIDWISEEDGMNAIYWIGTYTAPTEEVDEYKWTSERDKAATDTALFASTDDTKDFTYSNGTISYSASAMGITTTVVLEKTSDDAILNIEPSEPVETIPEGTYSDMGAGTIYITTPGGTSENGEIPVLYVSVDEFFTQVGLNTSDFDGSKLSYIYLDGELSLKEQLSDSQLSIDLSSTSQLSEGIHKVEILQFDNDDPTGNVITYKTASFENKLK